MEITFHIKALFDKSPVVEGESRLSRASWILKYFGTAVRPSLEGEDWSHQAFDPNLLTRAICIRGFTIWHDKILYNWHIPASFARDLRMGVFDSVLNSCIKVK